MPKETSNPGTGNKWSQVFTAANIPHENPPPPPPSISHENCTCPELEGWSTEELAYYEDKTSLKPPPHDCICSLNHRHWLTPSPQLRPHDTCMCPSADGWSDEEHHKHGTGIGFSASKYHCFCSGPKGHYVHIFEPPPVTQERCLCPEWAWTVQELEYHMAVSNRSATFLDCFCKNAQGYVVRQRPGVQNEKIYDYEGINDSKNDFVEAGDKQDSSTVDPTQSQSHLTVLSLDGNLKEIKLGSLWIKLTD